MAPQSVLITGCSEGGIGYALAVEFQKRGLHVFATTRTVAKMAKLENVPNITLLSLDVTSSDSIAAAVEAVKLKTGGTLGCLVNNSGSQYVMPVLDLDINKAKEMYEVNVWGVVAVTQAFAPLVISAKGSIVNMASIAGCMYPPFMGESSKILPFSPLGNITLTVVRNVTGLYSASKSALATVSEALRLEMKPFGVKVVTVITGSVESNIFVNAPEHHLPPGSLYGSAEKAIANRATGKDVNQHSTREDFAHSLVSDILGGASGKVYRGKMSTTARLVLTYMPTFIIVSWLFHPPIYFLPFSFRFVRDMFSISF